MVNARFFVAPDDPQRPPETSENSSKTMETCVLLITWGKQFQHLGKMRVLLVVPCLAMTLDDGTPSSRNIIVATKLKGRKSNLNSIPAYFSLGLT